MRWCVGENGDIGGGAKWPKEPIEVVQKVGKWPVRYSELVEVEKQRGEEGSKIGGRYGQGGGYDVRDL
jgi:hypothetical protein